MPTAASTGENRVSAKTPQEFLRSVGENAIWSGLAGLKEEAEALDVFLSSLNEQGFDHVTTLHGFTVYDVVRHLVSGDRLALLQMTDATAFAQVRNALTTALHNPHTGEPHEYRVYARLRALETVWFGSPGCSKLMDLWRAGLDALTQAAVATEGTSISTSRLLAERQMEMFCHGQDIFDTFEVRRLPTDRLYAIADLGVQTHALFPAPHDQEVPGMPFVRLLAPSGRIWTWGNAQAPDRIEGSAEQFCLVVTRRRNIADTTLDVTGPAAAHWMDTAQAVAGPPLQPPRPGDRAWESNGRPNAPLLPHAATIPAMVRYLTARYRDSAQIVGPAGETSFTEIEQRSARIASGLLARGAPKGARIGVLMPNGADWLCAMLAIQRIGGVAVLISTFAKGGELAHIIRHSDIHILMLSDRDFAHDLAAQVAEALDGLAESNADLSIMLTTAPFLRTLYIWGDSLPAWGQSAAALMQAGDEIPVGLLEAAEREVVAADPAVIIYTSGSSAEPKAVVHSQGNLVRQAHRMSAYMTYHPGDRLITTMPLFWVGGLVTSLLAANYCGAALVCPATPDPRDVAHAVADFGVTHMALWPAQLAAVIAHDDKGDVLQRLRPTSAQQLGLFGQATAERTPNGLGMTETLGPHSMEYYGVPLPESCAGSFGRKVGTIERSVIDPETGAPLPSGQTGELALRGGHMMLGMHRQESETIFTPDGWYRTGDLGRMSADGHFFFEGRGGDLVKSSGANISPREVELAFAVLPEIQEAVVLGMPDPALGEMLIAVLVLKPGATLDEIEAKARLRAKISSYKVPKRIFFMAHEALPRTPSAKIQKHRLLDMLRNA